MPLKNQYINNEAGFMLIIVLIIMFLLSFLSVTAITISYSNMKMKQMNQEVLRGFYLAHCPLDITKQVTEYTIEQMYTSQADGGEQKKPSITPENLAEHLQSNLNQSIKKLIDDGHIKIQPGATLNVDVVFIEGEAMSSMKVTMLSTFSSEKVKRCLGEDFKIDIQENIDITMVPKVNIVRSNWRSIY